MKLRSRRVENFFEGELLAEGVPAAGAIRTPFGGDIGF